MGNAQLGLGQAVGPLKTGNSDAYGITSDRHTSIGCRAGQSSHLEVSEGGNACDDLDRKSMLTCICFLTSSVGLGATCQVGLGATYVKAKDPIFKARDASPLGSQLPPQKRSPWLGSLHQRPGGKTGRPSRSCHPRGSAGCSAQVVHEVILGGYFI